VDILTRPACSNPVNMPDSSEMPIQGLPFITGEGSSSKITFEFLYQFTFSICTPFCLNRQLRAIASFADHMRPGAVQHESSITDMVPKVEVELQLKENLADAMLEMPSTGSSHLPGIFFNSINLY